MTHVALSILLGALIGLSLGLVGGGGSILTVPVLVYTIGQPVQAATTTSLAIVGLNALIGMAGHARKHRVGFRTGLIFGVVGIGGALVGSWLNTFIPARLLLVLFALIMLIAAVAMLRRRGEPSETGKVHDGARSAREWSMIAASGTVVGLMTGFFGVGGGFVIVPALVLVLGLSMRLAVGTSLLIIAINSAVSLAAHLRTGSLDLAITGLFVLGGLVGALVGVSLAGRVPPRRLTQIFAALIVVVAGYILYRTYRAGA